MSEFDSVVEGIRDLEAERTKYKNKLEAVLKVIELYKDRIPNTINIDIKTIMDKEK